MARQNRDVAKIGAVAAVSQNAAGGDQPAIVAGKAAEHAVAEHHFEIVRVLVAKWRGPIEGFKFLPVHAGPVVAPDDRHRAASTFSSNIGCATPYISVRHSHSTGP